MLLFVVVSYLLPQNFHATEWAEVEEHVAPGLLGLVPTSLEWHMGEGFVLHKGAAAWRRAERLFFWNNSLARPLLGAWLMLLLAAWCLVGWLAGLPCLLCLAFCMS